MRAKEFALYKGEELLAMGTKREIAKQIGRVSQYRWLLWNAGIRSKNIGKWKEISRAMKYKVIVYYDNMEDSEHVFTNKKRCD